MPTTLPTSSLRDEVRPRDVPEAMIMFGLILVFSIVRLFVAREVLRLWRKSR